MGRKASITGSLVLGLLLIVSSFASAAGEDDVKAVFTAFQAALKSQEAEKLWKLLDADSQKAAERAAKAVQSAYNKAGADDKAKMEKALGLKGDELAKLNGTGFLKTKGFRAKYDELSQSKIEKVVVEGDKVTVHYIEPDNDKEKLRMVRQGGDWKISAPMPPVAKP